VQLTKKHRLAWLSIILSVGVLAAACGGDDDDDGGGSETGSGGETSGDVSGEINVSGSSTVQPITTAAAEAFMAENADTSITVDGPGTGDGFELFCNGETEISDASRAIEEEEIATCEENGVEYIELQIAFDGMAVMTSPNNDAVECLSFADLYALIGPESEGFNNWSDAQDLATQLGSQTELPDEELTLVGPGPESGTYDSFIEIALSGIAEEQGLPEDQVETTRPDYEQSADDNQIIAGIEGADYSLGWVGFAFAEEAGDGVTELAVSEEPGGDCVEPSAETISDGSYPLSRPLYIYVNAQAAEENAAVAPFVDFYLAGLNGYVEDTGYVPMPDDQVSATTTQWEDRTTGAAPAEGADTSETSETSETTAP
jgi:phosphate transport system substrate-binding protein